MNERKALLLVTMEPRLAAFEEEFNDWYDTEHVPQRLAVPGIENGRRFVNLSGSPRYAALYDLCSVRVLESDAYRAISGEHSTPWSRRVLGRVTGYSRTVAEQVAPGGAPIGECATLGVIIVRVTAQKPDADAVALFDQLYAAVTDLARLRVFKAIAADESTYFGIAECLAVSQAAPFDSRIAPAAGFAIDSYSVYAPYRR